MHNQEELLRRVGELEREVARLRFRIYGDEDQPGVVCDIQAMQEALHGKNGDFGVLQKNRIMWNVFAGIIIAIGGWLGMKIKGALSVLKL